MKEPILGVLAATAEAPVPDTRRFYEKKRFILPSQPWRPRRIGRTRCQPSERQQPTTGSTTGTYHRATQHRDHTADA